MSTRAMYTFRDVHDTVHVYKHHDGYPSGALKAIDAAKKLAWELPRFEADEFAAAFVAANKKGAGSVRLCGPRITEPWEMAADAEYWYVIELRNEKLHVTVSAVNWRGDERETNKLFEGTLTAALRRKWA